ncbi:MAG: hypothetical protein KDC26_09205 [Armatimonadetes bacterium]|nr:hypothetical protein [Armatimonadota bacterium]
MFLPLLGIGAALIWMLTRKLKSNEVHPAELSPQSRSLVRPLRESIESLEKLLKAHEDRTGIPILGKQALETANTLYNESLKYALVADQLRSSPAKSGEANRRADAILDRIQDKVNEATNTIDELKLKFADSFVESVVPENDDNFDALISRLENINNSYTEIDQTLNVRNNE